MKLNGTNKSLPSRNATDQGLGGHVGCKNSQGTTARADSSRLRNAVGLPKACVPDAREADGLTVARAHAITAKFQQALSTTSADVNARVLGRAGKFFKAAGNLAGLIASPLAGIGRARVARALTLQFLSSAALLSEKKSNKPSE